MRMWIKNAAIEITIEYLENTTTHTVRLEPGVKPEYQALFTITSIHADSLVLRVPKGTCAMGHQVDIKVTAKTKDNEWPFRSRAKVTAVDDIDKGLAEVTLEIHNKDDIDFKRFMELFEKRQEQVAELFLAVKGK